MKHGKYYIGGLVLLGLIAGGTGLITNHSDSNKSAQSHKSVKTSSSTSQKQPKKRVDKEKKRHQVLRLIYHQVVLFLHRSQKLVHRQRIMTHEFLIPTIRYLFLKQR